VSGDRTARLRFLDRFASLLGILALIRLVSLYGFPGLHIPEAVLFAWSAILPVGFFLEALYRLLWVEDPWKFITHSPARYILLTMIVLEISGVATWGSSRDTGTSLLLGEVYLVIFLFGFAGSWAKGALLANRWLANQRIPVLVLPAVMFGAAIVLGAVVLALPGLHRSPPALLDSLFTATSALCVTGLAVYDVATTLNPAGQFVLAVLIQVGGLGILTVLGWMALWQRGDLTIGEHTEFSELVGGMNRQEMRDLLGLVLRVTLVSEGLGTLAFWLLWRDRIDHALPVGAFHAISAFCNAGFALFHDSFAGFREDPATLLVLMLLIVAGGAGFPVLANLGRVARSRVVPWDDNERMSRASRIVLGRSGILVLAGAVAFSVDGWMQGRPRGALEAIFQSVTTRTAGFQIESQLNFGTLGLVAAIVLMAIGASPQSTGGGIKTVVFTRLLRRMSLPNERESPHYRRETFQIAARLCAVYTVTGFLAAGALRWTDGLQARDAIFEAFSGLGTVGLTRDVTPRLSDLGKGLLIVLMFAGRMLYPTLVLAWTRSRRHEVEAVPWA
jgi:trk/ktr system potassium uptake protein